MKTFRDLRDQLNALTEGQLDQEVAGFRLGGEFYLAAGTTVEFDDDAGITRVSCGAPREEWSPQVAVGVLCAKKFVARMPSRKVSDVLHRYDADVVRELMNIGEGSTRVVAYEVVTRTIHRQGFLSKYFPTPLWTEISLIVVCDSPTTLAKLVNRRGYSPFWEHFTVVETLSKE